jgi:hypothetical protein
MGRLLHAGLITGPIGTVPPPVERLLIRCVWVFLSQDRMLNAYTQMQIRFAGMKPNWDVRKPITQMIKLLTIDIRSPVHDFRPTRTVANMVRKQER